MTVLCRMADLCIGGHYLRIPPCSDDCPVMGRARFYREFAAIVTDPGISADCPACGNDPVKKQTCADCGGTGKVRG